MDASPARSFRWILAISMLSLFFVACQTGEPGETAPPPAAPAPPPAAESPPDGDGGMPGPDAAALWTYITETEPYRDWPGFPGFPTPPIVQATEDPHGESVGVYVTADALEPLAAQVMKKPEPDFTMPYGSILVKENYKGTAEPANLTSLTVMYKVEGYHSLPDQEEWFWVMYHPPGHPNAGEVVRLTEDMFTGEGDGPCAGPDTFSCLAGEVQSMKPWFCLSCHQGAAEPNESGSALGDYLWNVSFFEPTGGS